MRIISHKQGRHRSKPYRLKIGRITRRSFRYYFNDEAKYDLKDRDQWDWNKLFGISFHLFSSHKNSAMIGWRYSKLHDQFEFNAYAHIGGDTYYTEALFVIPGSGSINLDIEVVDKSVFFRFSSIDHIAVGQMEYQYDFPKLNKIRRGIEAWFGGNRTAPSKVSFSRI